MVQLKYGELHIEMDGFHTVMINQIGQKQM